MTRLLGILLLISPLWAVSPNLVQEMQQARALMVKIYYQAFKERCDRVDNDMVYSNAMQKGAPSLVKHLQAFVNHIPLLQALTPKDPKQAQVIKALKAFEIFNLAAFLRDSIPDIDDCRDDPEHPERVAPFNAKKKTLKFLKGIELIYTPLIEAYHQGLDITDYLQTLQANLNAPNLYNYLFHMGTQEDILDMIKGAKTPTMRHFFKDFKYIGACNALINSRYNGFSFDIDSDPENFLQTQIIRSMGANVQQDLQLWANYYDARVLAFLGDYADQYSSNMENYWRVVSNVREIQHPSGGGLIFVGGPEVHEFAKAMKSMATAMQLTLPQNPTPCLQPQYLNQEAKAVCLQIFQQHTYNPKPLQKYLNSLRLLSIDNAPCVYLNSKDQLQAFKSNNALCLVLQKHFTKGLK
ncbi:hypothetical protein [Helicobacter vulpis]|uniref:hypothetical protein n=1 Tax=Helicobacter vulpis TaxID=2316076 RepID=UPI0013CDE532|nr:hypothetical protein [Helicobacter vulpis]